MKVACAACGATNSTYPRQRWKEHACRLCQRQSLKAIRADGQFVAKLEDTILACRARVIRAECLQRLAGHAYSWREVIAARKHEVAYPKRGLWPDEIAKYRVFVARIVDRMASASGPHGDFEVLDFQEKHRLRLA